MTKTLCTAWVVLLMAAAVSATTITLTPSSASRILFPGDDDGDGTLNENENTTPEILAIVAAAGYPVEIYKQNVGDPGPTGTIAGSYTTTFSNSGSDPSEALIRFNPGHRIAEDAYLLVKDGKAEPAWYFFDLTASGENWDGIMDIKLDGFWESIDATTGEITGRISHVSLHGTVGRRVPDGGSSFALLGGALLGIAGLRRMATGH